MNTEIWYSDSVDNYALVEWNPCRCCPMDTIITWSSRKSYSYTWVSYQQFSEYMKERFFVRVV